MPSATSIDNYHLHKRSGKLGTQAQIILDFLAMNQRKNFTRSELSIALPMRLSSVCGRVNSLVALGLISERPKRNCLVTQKFVTPVRIKHDTNHQTH